MKQNLLFSVLATLLPTSIAAAQTLEDAVKKQGNVEIFVNHEYVPATLTELAARADVVIDGFVIDQTSFVAKDGRFVLTDYVFNISDVIKADGKISVGSRITVRREGGAATVLGHTVRAHENEFPSFMASEDYVLFLHYDAASKTYEVLLGPQGALLIRNDVVSGEGGLGPWSERVEGVKKREIKNRISSSNPKRNRPQ